MPAEQMRAVLSHPVLSIAQVLAGR